jgi:hypothetical protein
LRGVRPTDPPRHPRAGRQLATGKTPRRDPQDLRRLIRIPTVAADHHTFRFARNRFRIGTRCDGMSVPSLRLSEITQSTSRPDADGMLGKDNPLGRTLLAVGRMRLRSFSKPRSIPRWLIRLNRLLRSRPSTPRWLIRLSRLLRSKPSIPRWLIRLNRLLRSKPSPESLERIFHYIHRGMIFLIGATGLIGVPFLSGLPSIRCTALADAYKITLVMLTLLFFFEVIGILIIEIFSDWIKRHYSITKLSRIFVYGVAVTFAFVSSSITTMYVLIDTTNMNIHLALDHCLLEDTPRENHNLHDRIPLYNRDISQPYTRK